MNIIGTIYQIGEVDNVTDNFRRREIIVVANKEDNKGDCLGNIKLQFEQRDVFRVNTFHIGDEVSIDFEIVGKKWIKKDGTEGNFTYLRAISIETVVRAPKPKAGDKQPAQVSDVALLEGNGGAVDVEDDMGSARHPKYPVNNPDNVVGDLPWERRE